MLRNAKGSRARVLAGVIALLGGLSGQAEAQFGGIGGFGSMGGFGGADGGGKTSPQSSRLNFSPWISANGTYNETASGRNSQAPELSGFGYGGSAGISGGKSWERTVLGGFYTGSYQDSNLRSYQTGLSQTGALSLRHSLTSRSSVSFSQLFGSTIGGYGYGAPAGVLGGWGMTGTGIFSDLSQGGGLTFGNPASNGVVDNEAFASRVNFSGTSGTWNYQPSLRWSFGASGSAMFVRRKGTGLSDLNSVSGGADVSYRISPRTSVGTGYWYSRFSYPNQFGGNIAQQAGIQLSTELTPRTKLEVMGGGYRFNTQFLGQVQMDSGLSDLLGQASILEVQKKKQLGWAGGARLSQDWRGYGFSLSYDHGITPGNGLMLASERDAVTASVGTTVKRLSLGAFAGYYRMDGILQAGSRTSSYSFGGNSGVRLAGNLYLGLNGGITRYETQTSARQSTRFVSVNLSWSPNDAAFRF